jgi:hypothetical protein
LAARALLEAPRSRSDQPGDSAEETILGRQVVEGHRFAVEAPGDIPEGFAGPALGIERRRQALVRRHEDGFIFGHDADELDRQHLEHVLRAEHVAAADHLRFHSIDNQFGRTLLFRFDEADDPIGVTDGGHLGVRDDEHQVGRGHGVAKASFDAGGRVDHEPVEVRANLVGQALHVLGRDGGLVARLGGRDEVQVGQALILDHRLTEFAAPLDDVDQVVDDAVLQSHDDVEVAQADVGVDAHDAQARGGQGYADVGGGGGLAHAALA